MEERLDDPTFQRWTLPRSRALIWPGDGLYSMTQVALAGDSMRTNSVPNVSKVLKSKWRIRTTYLPDHLVRKKIPQHILNYSTMEMCAFAFWFFFLGQGVISVFSLPGIELQLNNISPWTKREVMQMERNVKYEAFNSEHILSFGVKYMNWQEYVAIYSCYLEGRVSKQPRLEFAVFVFLLCHCAFVPRMLDSYNTKKPHRTRERWKPKWFN